MPAVAAIVAATASPATAFAVPPPGVQTAPDDAALTRMSGHAFAQCAQAPTANLTAAGKICDVSGPVRILMDGGGGAAQMLLTDSAMDMLSTYSSFKSGDTS